MADICQNRQTKVNMTGWHRNGRGLSMDEEIEIKGLEQGRMGYYTGNLRPLHLLKRHKRIHINGWSHKKCFI